MHISFINLPPHSRLWKEHNSVYIHGSFQEGGHNLEPVFAKTFLFQKYIFIQRLLQNRLPQILLALTLRYHFNGVTPQ